MSIDRELLELAAKAAGYKWQWFGATFCTMHDEEAHSYKPWSPLTSDGDALRLAVKLGIYVGTRTAEVWRYDKEIAHIFEDGGDEYQATRRAIVRAAAEIGKHSAPSDSGREG